MANSTKLRFTGEIDGLRLAIVDEIEGGKRAAKVEELTALLALLTAAADHAEEAGL